MDNVRRFYRFVHGSIALVTTGNPAYWAWVTFLLALIVSQHWGINE